MKKYYEYYEEISGEELFDGLLGYGLFSEKLPPIFDSTKFCEYCKDNNINFNEKNGSPIFNMKVLETIIVLEK